jgi:transposase
MEGVNITTKKIRIFPNTTQKKLFNKCFGTHNFFYNLAINEINERYHNKYNEFNNNKTCIFCNNEKDTSSFMCIEHKDNKISWNLKINLISLRNKILKSDKDIKGTCDEWQMDIPYDTRQLAIKDAINAYHSSIALKQKGYIDKFELHFRSKRSHKKIFWCDHRSIKKDWNLFKNRLKEHACLRFKKRDLKKLPEELPVSDFKIMKDHGSFYLIISIPYTKSTKLKAKRKVISLDPGIRCFQTGYDPQGIIKTIGDAQLKKIKILHKKIDNLKSIRSKKTNKRTKYNLRKKYIKIYKQIQDIIKDLHNQTACHLSKTYNSILLPEFGTSKMLKKELDSTVKRMMQTLSFYQFKQKLKLACYKNDSSLYIVTEEFTSKTCGSCGLLKKDLKSAKIYECNKCKIKLDRDVNGARNILLKHIT